jgi:hypothetical protein
LVGRAPQRMADAGAGDVKEDALVGRGKFHGFGA